MAKYTYDVVVIHKNRENDFYDFWDKGVKINTSGEELNSSVVGFNEVVEAKNLTEAISIVRAKHPQNIIATNYSNKIG